MYLVVVLVFLWIVNNREFVFGGFRPPIEVSPPPEASPDWEPTEFLERPEDGIKDRKDKNAIRMFDPTTGAILGDGTERVFSDDDVAETCNAARVAQEEWVNTSFDERREVLKLLQDYVVKNQELICNVASRDTGKTMVDGGFGEVLTTCEKISWTLQHGEDALKPDFRLVCFFFG